MRKTRKDGGTDGIRAWCVQDELSGCVFRQNTRSRASGGEVRGVGVSSSEFPVKRAYDRVVTEAGGCSEER